MRQLRAVEGGEIRAHGEGVDLRERRLAGGRVGELALPEVGEAVEVGPVGEHGAGGEAPLVRHVRLEVVDRAGERDHCGSV
jgi:hypothetical protein